MTRCEYIFTYEDFLESMKAYRKISRQAAIGHYLYVWILPMTGLVLGVLCFKKYMTSEQEMFGSLFWVTALGLGFSWGLPARYRLALKRGFKQRTTLTQDKPMLCEFDEFLIRFIAPGGAVISYPWESFTDYFENDRVIVLFVKDAAFHTIPKRALNDDQLIDLRQAAAKYAGKV